MTERRRHLRPCDAHDLPATPAPRTGPERDVDFLALLADDALLDLIGGAGATPPEMPGIDDPRQRELATLLLAWCGDTRRVPGPAQELPVAAVAETPPRAVRRRPRVQFVAAAAVTAVVLVGLGFTSGPAASSPGYVTVSAQSQQAAAMVNQDLDVAEAAQAAGQTGRAREALQEAREQLPRVLPAHGASALSARQKTLRREMGSTSTSRTTTRRAPAALGAASRTTASTESTASTPSARVRAEGSTASTATAAATRTPTSRTSRSSRSGATPESGSSGSTVSTPRNGALRYTPPWSTMWSPRLEADSRPLHTRSADRSETSPSRTPSHGPSRTSSHSPSHTPSPRPSHTPSHSPAKTAHRPTSLHSHHPSQRTHHPRQSASSREGASDSTVTVTPSAVPTPTS